MIEILKKIEKKTLILIIFFICFPILILILLAILQGCNSKVTYEGYLARMNSASLKYIKDYDLVPSEEGNVVNISLDELIESGYIKSTEKLLKDSTCTGEVTVRLNGSQIKSNDTGLLNPIPSLSCSTYSSVSLKDKILKDSTSSGSGVYTSGKEYIYKGDLVNNYIKIMDKNYLILGIDEKGLVKVINTKKEDEYINWDDKYNVEINNSFGINDYQTSYVQKRLTNIYESIDKKYSEEKKKIVSHDVCIGKRDKDDKRIDSTVDCSNILDNQILSLPSVTDYAKASLDENCTSIDSASCINFNYFKQIYISSWTSIGVTNNTYEVYYYNSNSLSVKKASTSSRLMYVMYIDGNEVVKSGDGSKNSPFELY